MKLHPEELVLARAYSDRRSFEGLTDEQLKQIGERARILYRCFRNHPLLHSGISIAVLMFLFTADYWVLLRLPRWFLSEEAPPSVGTILLASGVAGFLHSYLLYS